MLNTLFPMGELSNGKSSPHRNRPFQNRRDSLTRVNCNRKRWLFALHPAVHPPSLPVGQKSTDDAYSRPEFLLVHSLRSHVLPFPLENHSSGLQLLRAVNATPLYIRMRLPRLGQRVESAFGHRCSGAVQFEVGLSRKPSLTRSLRPQLTTVQPVAAPAAFNPMTGPCRLTWFRLNAHEKAKGGENHPASRLCPSPVVPLVGLSRPGWC